MAVFWVAAQPGCSAGHLLEWQQLCPAAWSAPRHCMGWAAGCRHQLWSPSLLSQHFLSMFHPSASFSLLSCCQLLLQREVKAALRATQWGFYAGNERLCPHLRDGDSGVQTSPWAMWRSLSFCPSTHECMQVARARRHV